MGYKTYHDRGRRATSTGPYTSRMMTQCLEREALDKGIRILDRHQAIKLLTRNGAVAGVLCLDQREEEEEAQFSLIWCEDIILATGGPAGLYKTSVYPASQLGGSGMALEAGARGKNLTEWQYGLASLAPRWNVSGTYMQVLPSFISTREDGSDPQEFLLEAFSSLEELLSLVFLKGYQWPFDTQKVFGGSSLINLLVYQETVLRGRRVYLDFRRNPGGVPVPYEGLSPEASSYLRAAGAEAGETPYERLQIMNPAAIQFYLDHQVDLGKQRLEIAICAQHNNGGLAADAWWETDVKGLFAIGEACGSHGVTRPGGTALNAGQVGALRAAERIRLRRLSGGGEVLLSGEELSALREEATEYASCWQRARGSISSSRLWRELTERMSACAAIIRSREDLKKELEDTERLLRDFLDVVRRPEEGRLGLFYRLRDMLITRRAYLFAMLDYLERGAGSRGTALYTDPEGALPQEGMPELFRLVLDEGRHGDVIQEVRLGDGRCEARWRPVRPIIPQMDYFFENQWREYRQREAEGLS